MGQEHYEKYLKMKQERSCFNCKFYDVENYCCMYECALRAIRDEDESASKCEHFKLGEYDQDSLEETGYR